VVLGRPKKDRLSYLQWQENDIPPQVVFEILSPSNTTSEIDKKLLFYDRYGIVMEWNNTIYNMMLKNIISKVGYEVKMIWISFLK
jgi:hypothetical protein